MTTTNKSLLSLIAGAAFTASLALSPMMASAEENPFAVESTSNAFIQLAEGKCGDMGKAKEAKCGGNMKEAAHEIKEGKCGGEGMKDKAKAMKEGKCGEAKCGSDKKSSKKCSESEKHDSKKCKHDEETKCGSMKKESKCGDMKGKAKKMKEGKCGEAKCGGSK